MEVVSGQIVELAAAHKWAALGALAIGLVVRLLKSDTKIPFDVPPRLRVWLAFGMGALVAVLEHLAKGSPWQAALIDGLTASIVAIVGHDVLVDSLRGGRELGIPGLIVEGAKPSPDKPVTLPPPATPTKDESEDVKVDNG